MSPVILTAPATAAGTMTVTDPGGGATYPAVTVHGQVTQTDGTTITQLGTVTIRAVNPSGDGTVYSTGRQQELVQPRVLTVDPDNGGAWEVQLAASSELQPAGSYYRVETYVAGGAATGLAFTVPGDAEREWIGDLIIATPGAGGGVGGTGAVPTHQHSAADITSGVLSIARIPTGVTSSTVAVGNHTHSVAVPRVTKTASYTAQAGDVGTELEMNTAAACTVTVPSGQFASGDEFFVRWYGVGQPTIAAGGGMTLLGGVGAIAVQYGMVRVVLRSSSEFYVDGYTA